MPARQLFLAATLASLLGQAAACAPPAPPAAANVAPAGPGPSAPSFDVERERRAIAAVLDDWHAAASRADEAAYFAHFTPDAVFLGTDATERWDVAAFRAYAHPHFERGKAWSFRAVRRAIIIAPSGAVAWFDEDLDTPNLGPARGSGVLVRDAASPAAPGPWRIAHYNLSVPIPNERFDEVKTLLKTSPP